MSTDVVCDGSPVGVGAILTQHKPGEPGPRVAAYNSRTLTPVEQRYGHIERESLAIMYGCLKNQLYLLRSTFTVVTDHKPLVSLYNNPRRPGPFRVERMRLKLQGFSFCVIYQSGKLNPTDYTSRQPQPFVNSTKEEKKISEELEAHVNWIVIGNVPPSLTLKEIQQARACDSVFKKLINGLETDTIDCVSESDLRQFCCDERKQDYYSCKATKEGRGNCT